MKGYADFKEIAQKFSHKIQMLYRGEVEALVLVFGPSPTTPVALGGAVGAQRDVPRLLRETADGLEQAAKDRAEGKLVTPS